MAEAAGTNKESKVTYDYPGHETDDANVAKVEAALTAKFGNTSYTQGLADSTKNAPIKEEDARGKIDKANQDAAQETKSNPDKVAKEKQESPAPPTQIAAPKQEVQDHNPTTAGPKAPQALGAGAVAKPPGKLTATPPAAAATAMPPAPQPLVLQAAASGDDQLNTILNGYNPKSPEGTERVSKINEMAEVAKGFDGKVDGYISTSGKPLDAVLGSSKDFVFGKKELNALSATENPYNKVHDQLSSTMVMVSRIQAGISIVGNVCQKLGLLLTILGLFGFIFPPIGAAIQAVARVLNVIGLVCDLLGAITSGVLVGLNGVVLARMIGKGASNEEKAAVADHLMEEANASGGHIMNLALAYGGKFMGGLKNASKGVIGNLFKKFKGVVGKFSAKTLGPVANWAKKIGYKFGVGLGKEPGMLSKAATKVGGWGKTAWNKPGEWLEKAKEASWVKKVNESARSQAMDKWAGKVNNHWLTNIDGASLEGVGEAAGEKVFTKKFEKRMEASAQAEEREAFEAAQKNAVNDAKNKERASIERDIKKQRNEGDALNEQGKSAESRDAYEKAKSLKAGEDKAVKKAEKDATKETNEKWNEKQNEQAAEKTEKADEKRREDVNEEKWKEDPEAYQASTHRKEKDLAKAEKVANNPKLSKHQREAAKEKAEELRKVIGERKEIGMKAGGLELERPKTMWDVGKKAIRDPIHEYVEDKEKEEGRDKYAEEDRSWTWGATTKTGHGGHADFEKAEAAERHEKIEQWEDRKYEAPSTSEQVEGLLAGLDDELGLQPLGDEAPAADADAGGDAGASVSAPDGASTAAPAAAVDQKDDGGSAVVAVAPQNEQPRPNSDESKSNGSESKADGPPDAQVPELAYWPDLTAQFASSNTQLGQMKLIAYGFRKAQAEAKKKALHAAFMFHDFSKDSNKRAQQAQEHGKSAQGSTDEAKSNTNAATQSGAKADEGSAKQQQANGPANGQAQGGPDYGEKPGLLHPIKRIWWYVKRWVSEKAAAVFGFIQEKIASMVLKVVCGISMGDLKGYTTALQHRMQASHGHGTEAIAKSNESAKKSAEDQNKATGYEQQAIDDAAECDQNMADADAFVKEVEESERDLAAEQAKAKLFMQQLHAAVQAERAQQEQEKQKKLAEQQAQQAGAGGGGAAAPMPVPVPKPPAATDPRSKKGQAKPAEPKPLNPSAIGKVKNAATYVVKQTHLMIEQLTASKQEQSAKLSEKLAYKGLVERLMFSTNAVGEKVVNDAKAASAEITDAMRSITGGTPTNAGDLQREAGSVKGKARQVDEIAHTAHEQLNASFKRSYDALAKC